METTKILLLGLSFLSVGCILMIFIMIKKSNKRLLEVNKLKRANKNLRKKIKIFSSPLYIGCKCLMNKYGLYVGENNFTVDLEVKILEYTNTMAKIEVIECQSDSDYYRSNNLKNNVINYMDNKWVKISSLDIIKNKSYDRSKKIDNMLGQ
jgi:hypothetical protein